MEETKRCPYCGEEILAVAKKCKHCGEWLEPKDPEREKKPCPICGEMIEADLDICPICHEPINDKKDAEAIPEPILQEPMQPTNNVLDAEKSNPYKDYAKLAFGAVVFGVVLSFAADCAGVYATKAEGLEGLFIGLGHYVPSWVGACLNGIGSIYLLWHTADLIGFQKKTEGRNDDATSFLLKALSVLYVSSDILGSFADERIVAVVYIILTILMGIFMAINGFILKTEKDSTLAGMGNAFIGNTLIAVWMLRIYSKTDSDVSFLLWLQLFSYVAWIYAMFSAHKYLLKRNK